MWKTQNREKNMGTVGSEQVHYVFSTMEYDLTRGMYPTQGNPWLQPSPNRVDRITKTTTEYSLSRFELEEMY